MGGRAGNLATYRGFCLKSRLQEPADCSGCAAESSSGRGGGRSSIRELIDEILRYQPHVVLGIIPAILHPANKSIRGQQATFLLGVGGAILLPVLLFGAGRFAERKRLERQSRFQVGSDSPFTESPAAGQETRKTPGPSGFGIGS